MLNVNDNFISISVQALTSVIKFRFFSALSFLYTQANFMKVIIIKVLVQFVIYYFTIINIVGAISML